MYCKGEFTYGEKVEQLARGMKIFKFTQKAIKKVKMSRAKNIKHKSSTVIGKGRILELGKIHKNHQRSCLLTLKRIKKLQKKSISVLKNDALIQLKSNNFKLIRV